MADYKIKEAIAKAAEKGKTVTQIEIAKYAWPKVAFPHQHLQYHLKRAKNINFPLLDAISLLCGVSREFVLGEKKK